MTAPVRFVRVLAAGLLAACGGHGSTPPEAGIADDGHGADGPGGVPPELVTMTPEPAVALAVDATGLWWTARGPVTTDDHGAYGSSGVRFHLRGGEQGHIGGRFFGVGEIAIAGDDVFFSADGDIHHAYASQGSVQLPSRVRDGDSIAIAGEMLFLSRRSRPGAVESCPRTGCEADPPAFATSETFPYRVAVHGDTLYWLAGETPTFQIRACPIAGCAGSPQVIGTFTSIAAFVVDETSAYTLGYGALKRCPLAGCTQATTSTIASIESSYTAGLAADETHVYFSGGEVVARVAKGCVAPCTAELLATGQVGVAGLAVDGTHVYWITAATEALPATNAIWRLPK